MVFYQQLFCDNRKIQLKKTPFIGSRQGMTSIFFPVAYDFKSIIRLVLIIYVRVFSCQYWAFRMKLFFSQVKTCSAFKVHVAYIQLLLNLGSVPVISSNSRRLWLGCRIFADLATPRTQRDENFSKFLGLLLCNSKTLCSTTEPPTLPSTSTSSSTSCLLHTILSTSSKFSRISLPYSFLLDLICFLILFHFGFSSFFFFSQFSPN